jgi:hypothetical protein
MQEAVHFNAVLLNAVMQQRTASPLLAYIIDWLYIYKL